MNELEGKKRGNDRSANKSVAAIHHADESLPWLARAVAIRPTNRSQYGSHTGERTNKYQHGEGNHQEKCGSHVVQNRDHPTSLLLLETSTAPSTGTNPWTHWIGFLKRSPATGALPSPHLPYSLAKHYFRTRLLIAISAKPTHRIIPSFVKCRSCSASGPCHVPLGLTSTHPQPIAKTLGYWISLVHHQKFTLRRIGSMAEPTASIR